jgi:hypothetical protein
LFDPDSDLVCAVNMFINITYLKQTQRLREQAIQCRRLADGITDRRTPNTLASMAAAYEEKARRIEDA